MQRILNKKSQLSFRNHGVQKADVCRIQSAERKTKILTNSNFICDKTMFQNEEEMKTFPDNQKLRDFITTGPSL